MSNKKFLEALENSFQVYLKTGARSNKKLEVLHSFIAKSLMEKLNDEFVVSSLGVGDGKEKDIRGRYMDKKVDIVISRNNKLIAGIAVKFVMSNYSQNSNNYFENMLGETANLRTNKIPYFHVIVLTEHAPYFDRHDKITKIETITDNNLHKYMVLSNDNTDLYLHSPSKTLLYIIKADYSTEKLIGESREKYKKEFRDIKFRENFPNDIAFGNNIILNDFTGFIEKIAHFILSI